MRRRFPILALLALGAASLTACKPREVPKDIRIGVIAELTGEIPAVGASCKNAAVMAVAEINEAGGLEIGGSRHGLALVIEDSAATADKAAAAARKLAADGVLAIVGPNASLGAVPAADVAEAAKVPLITPWSTAPRTTLDASGQPKKYVFRACFTDAFEGHLLARFGSGYMHAAKAAVLYNASSEAPRSQAELFRKDFEKIGGQVVAFETYTTGEKDFAQQFGRIKAAAPDLIFLPSYYDEVPIQLKQAHQLGLKVPFLGSDTWSSPELIKQSGPDADGAYFCNHYSPEAKNTITGTFVVSYKKRHGGQTPDDGAALTYDSFSLLTKALTAAGKLDRQAVRDALAKISDFEGVTGKMKFRGTGDPIKSAVMMQIKDGKVTFITSVDPE